MVTGMPRPILILDCYIAGSAADNIQRNLAWPTAVVRAGREPLPDSLARYAGVVITGSAASAITGPDSSAPGWVAPLVEWLADALRTDKPVLGICFGHQVVAAAACGPDAVQECVAPEVGWLDIERDPGIEDPLLAGFPSRFRTFVSHAEEVVAGADIQILASSPNCPVQAYRLGSRPVWGVQFHCEMLADEEADIVRGRARKHPSLGLVPNTLLATRIDSQALARQLVYNFSRQL